MNDLVSNDITFRIDGALEHAFTGFALGGVVENLFYEAQDKARTYGRYVVESTLTIRLVRGATGNLVIMEGAMR